MASALVTAIKTALNAIFPAIPVTDPTGGMGALFDTARSILASIETAYTPTFQGFGTPTSINFTWTRVGNRVKVMGKFMAGTTTAVEARISLPNGIISDAALIPNIQPCGLMVTASGYAGSGYCLIESGVSYITCGINVVGQSGLTKLNGSSVIGTGGVVAVTFELPVSGWNT